MTGEAASLKLQNVYLIEIRAQYKSLISMYDSYNLILENTHFDKIQTSRGESYGVLTVENSYDFNRSDSVN